MSMSMLMSMSKSMMLMCRLRSFVRRRSFSTTSLLSDAAKARALWAGRFRMEKKLLGNTFNIFLFKADIEKSTKRSLAYEQLKVHIQLAQQFCQISDNLYTALDDIRSKDAAFTPYIHPLSDVVEILNWYYGNTSEVNEDLRIQWFGTKRRSKLFQQWRDLQKDVKQKAQSLEAFLPPDRSRPKPDGKVPLESLFELSIQCYLDCFLIRQPKQVSIEHVQELLRKAFPNLGKLIAAPTVIFLSSTVHGYHIGGNALHFDIRSLVDNNIHVRDPFKVKKIYSRQRHLALKDIKESIEMVQRYEKVNSAMKLATNQTKVDQLEECVQQDRESALYLGHQGQAMRVGSFEPRGSCGKCYYTYGFAEAPVEGRDTTIYPMLACAEDMWALKAWLMDGHKV